MLEINGVSKQFHTNRFKAKKFCAVDDVSLSLSPGKTVGLVGESGSGKTTLGLIAAGLLFPTKGEVFMNGIPLFSRNKSDSIQIRKNIQIIFQSSDSALDPRMTTSDLIREPFLVNHVNCSDDTIIHLMKKVGLGSELSTRYPHELSGGQRQRICIARAMAFNPSYLIADEPAASLDYSVQAQILELIKKIQIENNIGLLFISHHLKIVTLIADVMSVMFEGRIIETGPPDVLFLHPLHPYTRDLIASLPGIHRRENSSCSPLTYHEKEDSGKGCTYYSRCTLGTDLCAKTEPEMRIISEKQRVACHHICMNEGTILQ